MPAQTGFTTAYRNVGSIVNKGVEFAVNYNHTIRKDFTYGIGLNLSTVSNKLLSLATGESYINNLGDLGFSTPAATTGVCTAGRQ